jgi:alanyl-tRNA synthetase
MAGDLAAQAESVADAKVLIARVEAPNQDAMIQMGDALKQRLPSAVIVLGALIDGRPSFVVMVTPNLTKRVSAGVIVKRVAMEAGGNGGGPAHLGRGAGTDPAKLGAALALARRLAEEALSGAA